MFDYTDNLIAGLPVHLKNFKIYPKPLKTIIEDKSNYNRALSVFLLTKKDLGFSDKKFEKYNLINVINFSASADENFKKEIIFGLEYFTDAKVTFDKDFFILNEDILLTQELFEDIRKIILDQNMIDLEKLKESEEDYDPGNEKAREMAEKFKANKEHINKIKKSAKPKKTLGTQISKFCAKSPNLSVFLVLEMALYTFYAQFDDLIGVDNYDKGVNAIHAGADPKKLKITHWAE